MKKKNLLFLILVFEFWFLDLALSKTIQPIYEDPFDQGSGGSVLTWATQEGILLNNPAQLPYGGKTFKWLGLKTSLEVGKDSIQVAQNYAKQGAGSSALSLAEKPIHLGASQALSFLTKNAGITAFASVAPDVRLWKEGIPDYEVASPSVVIRAESYNGVVASLASRSFCNCLAFGASAKYLVVSDAKEVIDLAAQSKDSMSFSANSIKSLINIQQGFGFDVSSLFFQQSSTLDFRAAATYSNVGGTKLTGNANSILLKPMLNAGVGVTIHSEMNALHLAVDYRDLLNSYDEDKFKKIFMGGKLLVYHFVGFGAGYYNGYPSLAFEVNLFLFRIALSSYTREYGSRPGYDTRPIYVISFSSGFSF